ncbi:MAG: hypothetical protein WAO98_08495, partial [Alphaproteobacteria bacterium]
AGCVVAGFTGLGGKEYAHEQNGFWASEDDFPTCVANLKKAVDLSLTDHKNYSEAATKTVKAYTPQTFKQAVKEAWSKILA